MMQPPDSQRSRGEAAHGISFLLIDIDTPGITIQPIVTIDGQHHINQTFFNEVWVPIENLVGEEGQGRAPAKFLLSHERVAIADTGHHYLYGRRWSILGGNNEVQPRSLLVRF